MNTKPDLIKILNRYQRGQATPEEKIFVEKWYASFNDNLGFTERLSDQDKLSLEQRMEESLRQRISDSNPRPFKQPYLFWLPNHTIAASVILLIITGIVFYLFRPETEQTVQETITAQDLTPGSNKATLTLSDGSLITLDSAATGMLASQGNTMIYKVDDGIISYKADKKSVPTGLNTIVAPAGGKYCVELSDGSRVWLNSESSITFPASFSENVREVNISGEVFFDIMSYKNRPFLVKVDDLQQVKVLGTQFNINAYKDEGLIKTTLFEGSVEIINQQNLKKLATLKPGEQSTLSGQGDLHISNDINPEEILGWKNGNFQFENTDLTTVMKQLGRWYNVEVSFREGVPPKKFTGKIDQNMNASQVFEILKFTGLNFIIDRLPTATNKGKVIVLP